MTTTLQNFAIDPAHTSVEFLVRHMMLAKVRGRFAAASGSLCVPIGATVPEAVEVSIDVASLDTREEQRDAHLKSPDFLDAELHPKLSFVSTRIEGSGDHFQMHGNLALHGVTREVVLEATFEGRGNDPWRNERIAYSAHRAINRKDFGLVWNQALETGGVLVGDEVRIEIDVEAIAQT